MSQEKQCARMEFNDSEAKAANQTRDQLLKLFAENLLAGCEPEHPSTQALVERYRREYIDIYLFPSTPIQIFGMGKAIAIDPHNRRECEAYEPGMADYLSQAMIAYYQNTKN